MDVPLPAPTISSDSENDWSLEAAFFAAAYHGNVRRLKEVASSLDRDGVGVETTVATITFRDMNALHAAGGIGSLPMYRYLVEVVKMDVNKPDTSPFKNTPLGHAVAGGNLPAVRYLLDHGADLHQESEHKVTALHIAAKEGRCVIAKLLLSRGARVDGKSDFATPLHHAAFRGHDSTLEVLLQHRADPNKVRADYLHTPLDAALQSPSLSCVKLLIQAGADVNGVNNPLARAAKNGFTEAIKCLLDAGANPNFPDSYGRLPIEIAAVCGTREDVEILFPFTLPIPAIPNWIVDEIIKHVKLEHKKLEDYNFVRKKWSELKRQGEDAFKEQDYLNASVFYSQALIVDPDDARLLVNRSVCWLCLGEGRKALEDASRCIIRHPMWAGAYRQQGAVLMFLKDYAKACEAFRRGLELDPENDELSKVFCKAMELKQNTPETGED
ncbi:unnamed protein product [Alopecurus aequalis]